MKKKFKPLSLSVGIAIAILILTSGCSLGLSRLPDTLEEQLEAGIDHGLDGIILCIQQPEATQLYAAGWKNREQQLPADPYAFFKIASISKLYIAAAAAKLISSGQLSLGSTLSDYLPELAGHIEYADEITLEMLLRHRSGIPDYADHPDYPWTHPYAESSDTYELILDQPADFKPGKRYAYSNTNYLLIGDLLDHVLGYSHHQYIQEHLLDPQGLVDTYHLLADVDMDEMMSGYFVGYEQDIKANDFVQPGGSMVATAEDVAYFLRALKDGILLQPKEQVVYAAVYEYEHTGLLPGYQSIARYDEELDAVVVLFVNTSGGNSWSKMETLYRRILRILKKQ